MAGPFGNPDGKGGDNQATVAVLSTLPGEISGKDLRWLPCFVKDLLATTACPFPQHLARHGLDACRWVAFPPFLEEDRPAWRCRWCVLRFDPASPKTWGFNFPGSPFRTGRRLVRRGLHGPDKRPTSRPAPAPSCRGGRGILRPCMRAPWARMRAAGPDQGPRQGDGSVIARGPKVPSGAAWWCPMGG